MRKLQVCQNKIMRLISGLDYLTSTNVLLETTNQLSVHQLVAYHTACQVYQTSKSKLPVYHYNRLFETKDNVVQNKQVDFHLTLGKSNFFYQSSLLWSLLPTDIQDASTIGSFKRKCKAWVKETISIHPYSKIMY